MLTQTNDRSDIEAAIYTYLTKRFPSLECYEPETSLLESGVVDSLGILELMSFLTERFGITLEDEDLDPDNLETPARLVEFVRRKRQS
jgi:acyl carrier protein